MKMKLLLVMAALLACARDRTPPTPSAFVPAPGAENVARNSTIRVMFSEEMDEASAEAAFSIEPAVTGTFSWQEQRWMAFAPDAPLDSLTQYTVTVSTEASDLAGNHILWSKSYPFTTGATSRTARIVMFGRSVLEGWFYHWGWDGNEATPVQRLRFTLEHRYLTQPEGDGANTIADFRQQVVALNVDDSPAVFVKLCFVDFEGGDSATAQANLDRNERLVDSLYAVVAARGLRLVVGNALPVTKSEHDAWRYWNHLRYNSVLTTLANAHPRRVSVLDLYSYLTDWETHSIRQEYRIGADDPHPNPAGYDAIDPALDALLEQDF
jgi:lysophospholipase L1-like esterase